MGLLDGEIAQQIYNGFKGQLLKGTLMRDSLPVSPVINDRGQVTNKILQQWSCEGFVDSYNDVFRVSAGIPATDSKVSIFAKSLPSGIEPIKDDRIVFNSKTWQVRERKTDPATALWECQSYEVSI